MNYRQQQTQSLQLERLLDEVELGTELTDARINDLLLVATGALLRATLLQQEFKAA